MIRRFLHPAALFLSVLAVAFLFAEVEVQIEGASGWAASLPTWRIEKHWLLDLFFGGRVMTGYHAWTLPCILAFFHLPMAFSGTWSWRLQARAAACYGFFWIAEDALWFAVNPAFGWAKLTPEHATWHKHWLLGVPVDYLLFSIIAGWFFLWSFQNPRRGA